MALEGRVALVTGAGRGIGRAHALRMAGLGADVVVNDVDPDVAEAVASEIVAAGGQAVADSTDVASIEGGRTAVAVAVDQLGRVDIVVNNAGFASGGGTVDEPDGVGIDALLDVHL